MPLAIASQSSWILGLNTVIARMAITTRTPTRIAYSVVPCPFLHASFAFADAWRLWAMRIARVRARAGDGAETQDAPSREAAGER